MGLNLGTHGINHALRKLHIFAGRTARQDTVETKGIDYAKELVKLNLLDLLKIMQWNADNNIHFYRLTSDFAPHITNPYFIPKKDLQDYTKLAYDLSEFKPIFKKIGEFAKINNIRLTFHPGQYTSFSSDNPELIIRSKRDLHFHITCLEMMNTDCNSVCVIHGGGIYNDKIAAMNRWINNFNSLPLRLKQRIVLENDEECYSIEDVLYMSSKTDKFNVWVNKIEAISSLPVVFDIFHYYCYDQTLKRREHKTPQPTISEVIPKIVATWGIRQIKMHLSNQKPDGPLGAHSDYVKEIPRSLLLLSRKQQLDLMIEAKAGEQATLFLMKKYKKYLI